MTWLSTGKTGAGIGSTRRETRNVQHKRLRLKLRTGGRRRGSNGRGSVIRSRKGSLLLFTGLERYTGTSFCTVNSFLVLRIIGQIMLFIFLNCRPAELGFVR